MDPNARQLPPQPFAKRSRRLAFIHAPKVYFEQSYGVRFAPIWAYTLASHLPKHWTSSVHDSSLEPLSSIGEAEVFAFSGINQDLPTIIEAHQFLKARYPKAKFILGGPITWSFDKEGKISELEFFDHIFILDGEESFPRFLADFDAGRPIQKIIRSQRFPVHRCIKMDFDLMKKSTSKYYGGVVEVARGCPFLCEFCDIRVLPQNNETNVKSAELIVEEIQSFYDMGVRQIQLACDNFIGDLQWANNTVDAILAWSQSTGAKLAFHTWVTVNISSHSELLNKMRRAGFTSLFIGVESFNQSSIIETGKVQNRNDGNQMVQALRTIHSHGFIVAPGLIFGFDSDPPEMFDILLEGARSSGLIGGDPTFLIALPGTPLYKRMKASRRLVGAPNDFGNPNEADMSAIPLYRERISKIESNIRYLQPKNFLIEGYLKFIRVFSSPSYAYSRLSEHVNLVMQSKQLELTSAVGYGNLPKFIAFQFSSTENLKMFLSRLALMLRPSHLWVILKGMWLVAKHAPRYPGIKNHFYFWLFSWTNLALKYRKLTISDFKLHSVPEDYPIELTFGYVGPLEEDREALTGGRNQEGVKISLQLKQTLTALQTLRQRYNKSGFVKDTNLRPEPERTKNRVA